MRDRVVGPEPLKGSTFVALDCLVMNFSNGTAIFIEVESLTQTA